MSWWNVILVAPAIRTKKSAFTALFFVLNHRMIQLERATVGREPRIRNAPVEYFLTQGAVCLMNFRAIAKKMNLANKLSAKPSLVAPANNTKRSSL